MIDREELPNKLYRALAHDKVSTQAVSLEVIKQYKAAATRNSAHLAVINFILQACGCKSKVTVENLEEDRSEIIREYSDIIHQSSIVPPMGRLPHFRLLWIEFWQRLIENSHNSGLLYSDNDLVEPIVIPWIISVSAAHIRAWREAATMAAFAMIGTMNQLIIRSHDRFAIVAKQSEDKTIAAAKRKELKEELIKITAHMNQLESMVKTGRESLWMVREKQQKNQQDREQ